MAASIRALRVSVTGFSRLLDAARAGEGWAFEELFRTWSGPVTGFVRARGAVDVAGIVNDVFLRAFGALHSFEGDEAGFRAWLFAIARNRVIDEFRTEARRPVTIDLDSATVAVAAGDVVEDAERHLGDERVLRLLETLTEDQREVLTLRFVADLTVDQIAEVTGRRRGAVKQLQRRALRRLESVLEADG